MTATQLPVLIGIITLMTLCLDIMILTLLPSTFDEIVTYFFSTSISGLFIVVAIASIWLTKHK